MKSWKAEMLNRAVRLVEEGLHPEDAVRDIIPEYRSQIEWDAEASLLRLVMGKQKKAWAEPVGMEQLRFELEGHEICTSDAPVRTVDEDGQERFKPARYSTAIEREASLQAKVLHHLSWARRSEAEHTREVQQNGLLASLGVDLSLTWDEIRHKNNTCWRCGLGWRAGDPFEMGHNDRPASQGGVEVAWEHRSCNRSAQDNPVSSYEQDANDEEAA